MKPQKHSSTLLLAVCLCFLLSACSKSEEAIRVDELIDSIGEVTLDSEPQIVAAEEAAKSLVKEDYEQLDKITQLEQARLQYDTLVVEETERLQKEQIAAVEAAISGIGTVTLDSEKDIAKARKLYDECVMDVRRQISNYELLTTAEKNYATLCAAEVIDLISQIGSVSLEIESVTRLNAATTAYNSLDTAAKEEVTNLQILTDAQNVFKSLKAEADKQVAIEQARSIIRVKRIWCSKPDSAGGVELYFNFTNNSEKTIKYVNFGATFYNAVGDVVTCRIKDDTINYCQETGPYEKGEGLSGSNWYWGKFYSWDISSVKLVYLSIDYMDGSSVTLTDDQIEYVQY